MHRELRFKWLTGTACFISPPGIKCPSLPLPPAKRCMSLSFVVPYILCMLVGAGIQVTCLQPCHLQRQRSHIAVLHRFVQLRNKVPVLSILEDHKTDKLRLRYHTLPNLRYSGDMFPFCRRTTSIQLRKHTGLSSAKLRVPAGQIRFKVSSVNNTARQSCLCNAHVAGHVGVSVRQLGSKSRLLRHSKFGRLWHY